MVSFFLSLSPFVALLSLDRASFLQVIAEATATSLLPTAPRAKASQTWRIRFPIEDCAGGSYCVRMRVASSRNSFRMYRAAVDTGSPYLVLSGNRDIMGGSSSGDFSLADTPYPPTEEVYGSVSGLLEWKQAQILFRSHPRMGNVFRDTTILAQMDDQLEAEAGGTLLGLVKHPNPPRQKEYYRPTWLQQLTFPDESTVASFSINDEALTVSNRSLLSSKNAAPRMPLVDLRPLGDFIEHYCVAVKELILDGRSISSIGGRPIAAVLDTGLTGCLLTQPFWDALASEMDPKRIRTATVRVQSTSPKAVVDLTSGRGFNNLFYVAPIKLDWFVDEPKSPHLIVLGQTFLSQGTLTVDVEDRLAAFEL